MIASLTPDDCLRGGNDAGAYLDSIGQTDLQKLTPDQWRTVCILIVNGANRSAGERIVGAWLAPFHGEDG